ncbi:MULTISPECIES: hypothetical protein [Methylobacterium]|uniref:hypothetical protein n=1 Tax=Methylobacterium TaxID=407 RepID=UPI0013EA01D7|nr:hypothetical protein [Methylobacterium sp. DB0501]NGM33885.1 hypothetical protein [Methylobacterium sp. DB0501]
MAKSTKTPVTLIQNAAGAVVAVRIGGSDPIAVQHAGPVVGIGVMNLALTVADVDISYEAAPTEDAKA